MKEIKFKSDSVEVSGLYYTSVDSVHYDKEKQCVRIQWRSDRCTDQEFLDYLYQELPELKNMKLSKVYDEEIYWLCNWNVGNPKNGPFSLTIMFFD